VAALCPGQRLGKLGGDRRPSEQAEQQATWVEFAGGGTVKVNGNWSAYAQAGYQFAVAPSNVQRNGFTGDIGLRYTW
jgi:outer membrane autotransporter protein